MVMACCARDRRLPAGYDRMSFQDMHARRKAGHASGRMISIYGCQIKDLFCRLPRFRQGFRDLQAIHLLGTVEANKK